MDENLRLFYVSISYKSTSVNKQQFASDCFHLYYTILWLQIFLYKKGSQAVYFNLWDC